MEWADAISLFGTDDREAPETALKVSVACPRFGARDLLEVFRLVAANYRKRADVSDSPWVIPAAPGNGRSLAAMLKMMQDRIWYRSDVILRNLHRVMFSSPYWDFFVMTPEFIEGFSEIEAEAKQRSRADVKKSKFQSLDLHEALAEFKDKLAEKARLASGM